MTYGPYVVKSEAMPHDLKGKPGDEAGYGHDDPQKDDEAYDG